MCDEDDDDWEDEQYVFVELVGMVDPDKLMLCNKENTAILGIDDDTTVLKLGGYAFAGTYQDSCGSMVLFEETEHKQNKQLHYRCHTTKILKTTRVFLKKKEKDEAAPNENKEKSNDDDENVDVNTSGDK